MRQAEEPLHHFVRLPSGCGRDGRFYQVPRGMKAHGEQLGKPVEVVPKPAGKVLGHELWG